MEDEAVWKVDGGRNGPKWGYLMILIRLDDGSGETWYQRIEGIFNILYSVFYILPIANSRVYTSRYTIRCLDYGY